MPPLGDAPGIMPKRRFPRGFRALRGNTGDARRPASKIAGRAAADAREAAARDRNHGSSPPNGRFGGEGPRLRLRAAASRASAAALPAISDAGLRASPTFPHRARNPLEKRRFGMMPGASLSGGIRHLPAGAAGRFCSPPDRVPRGKPDPRSAGAAHEWPVLPREHSREDHLLRIHAGIFGRRCPRRVRPARQVRHAAARVRDYVLVEAVGQEERDLQHLGLPAVAARDRRRRHAGEASPSGAGGRVASRRGSEKWS